MRTLITLSDRHYLDKGIAMFESVERLMEEFVLYYLCLDRYSYDKLSGIDDRLIPMFIDNEFRDNKDFDTLVKHNQSTPNGYSDFHFALGSFFSHYIMEQKSPESLLYVDSDILFYYSPEIIFHHADKSIGLVLHRHNRIGAGVGGFNVGVIYFKGDPIGKKALKWWRDVVMDKTNKWFKTHGGCGDQKYLELFSKLFGRSNVKILDDNIGHGAPWNFLLYRYLKKSVILWRGKKQLLVFNHFSHFNYNDKGYRVMRTNEWPKRIAYPPVKAYYDEYFRILKDVKKRYEL